MRALRVGVLFCFLVVLLSCQNQKSQNNSTKIESQTEEVIKKEVVKTKEKQTIGEFISELKSVFASNDLNGFKALSKMKRDDILNEKFIQDWNTQIQDVGITQIEESMNIPGALEFQIEKSGEAFIIIVKMQENNTYKIIDVMGIG